MKSFIKTFDDALTATQCRQIIERFEASADVAPGRTASGVEPHKKDSQDITISDYGSWSDLERQLQSSVWRHLTRYTDSHRALVAGALSHSVPDPRTGERVEVRLENFDEVGLPHLESLLRHAYRLGRINLQKYDRGRGGYHRWHSEIYPDPETPETLERVLLFQFYLNDVAAGGETEFLYQRQKIRPKAGRLLIAPAGFTHTHKGHVPRSDDKYVATSWVLFQSADALYRR